MTYIKAGIFCVLLLILLILYINGRQWEEKDRKFKTAAIAVLLALPGLLCAGTLFVPVILTGVAFTAAVRKTDGAVFYTVMLFLLLSAFGLAGREEGIFLLINGILISILLGCERKGRQLAYSLLLIVSADIILISLYYNFSMRNILAYPAILVLASVLLAFTAGNAAGLLYIKGQKKEETTIENMLEEDFGLYKLLRESDKLWQQGMLIGDISERAAAAAGLDSKMARAGGLYHEIGKLRGKDYVTEGVALAREYRLPEVIENIIASHNLKAGKPASPEGAVVMLTVSLVSAREYFQANGQEEEGNSPVLSKLMTKFTENLFAMRLEKDSLEDSGLTVGQYISLKKFYLSYFGEEEKNIDTSF